MLHTQFENQITYGKIQKRLQWVYRLVKLKIPDRLTASIGVTFTRLWVVVNHVYLYTNMTKNMAVSFVRNLFVIISECMCILHI